jgi:AraC-like DNA-binding protein
LKPILEKIYQPETQSFFLEEVVRKYFIDLWHFHPEIEILYIKEGSGTKYVGDSIYPFNKGDIVIIGSNTPHVWVCDPEYQDPDNNLMTKAICIQFENDFLERSSGIPEFYKINNFINDAKRGIQILKKEKNILIELIEELPSLVGMKKLLGLLTILDIMSLSKSIKYLSSPNYKPLVLNSDDQDRMGTIFNYVIKNFSNKIYLEEIASRVNLTPQSFCRFFKSRTTKVFSAYVNEVKIGNACKMLIENRLSISEICFSSGFNYLSNFNRQFKHIKGMTPSEFQSKYGIDKFNSEIES